ncbi:hypothetical protein C0992_007768 [Termitomyces sp. T32_za158]|nr:hypothetical protein C0992_007768 [Termitomyces sp. T32_za158]
MALGSSPRKVVPLASGDDLPQGRARKDSSGPGVTKRVFYCGVVVEGSENDIQDLVLSLGNPLAPGVSAGSLSSGQEPGVNETDRATQRTRDLSDTTALSSVINELVTSERSYVRRLQILKNDYADPLRNFARSKDTAIIPTYEANTLFGNIDNLIPVNEAFLTDLEKMLGPNGPRTVGGVGDVALRHFKELRGFEQYKQYYVKREDAQLIFEREISKRSSRFASFIDHIKYQSADPRNRVGLRELLMEPVQRIPRYTLLFRTMLKHMAMDDPQRVKLLEADEIASKIALAEADEQTKRAAIFYCLTSSIEGFPPDLFSNSRRFIDSIDVEDILNDASAPVSSSSSTGLVSLHCTLFLFDDKLVIVKRPGNGEKSGQALSGLDELDKITKSGATPGGKKKTMTCKGVVDVTGIVATDVGGADFHFYLETPPQDQGDRWSGRPFRALSVVHPPHPINMNPAQTTIDKQRFLENLWYVQATYRSRAGQSVVLRADEQEVESKVGKVTIARTYFNVYQRTAFLQEVKKQTKIVVHIDPLGSSDALPLGLGVAPFASIRIQPLAGQLCRYTVRSSMDDDAEEDIVQTERVPSRIIDTIHQFGFFEFRTDRNSRPSTPTARSRVNIFGLDAISRNLFNTRPGSSMGDFFGGSISGHKRTKSTTSRSSMYTQTTSTGDSLTKFSHRSTSTAATSVMDDDASFLGSRSSKGKKLLKRGKSPGGSTSDSEKSPSCRLAGPASSSRSRSTSRELDDCHSENDEDDEDDVFFINSRELDDSERDLALQLELARRNSKNQHTKEVPPLPLDEPTEPTIYEGLIIQFYALTKIDFILEELPQPIRPSSRASRDSASQRTATPRPESTTPTKALEPPVRPSRSPPPLHTIERRPLGPRSPSPLPPARTSPAQPLPSTDDDTIEEPSLRPSTDSLIPAPSTRLSRGSTNIPRSKRQPFYTTGNRESTSKAAPVAPSPAATIEPLSIKKKSSVRSNGSVISSPTPMRRTFIRNSSLARNSSQVASPRRVSPQVGKRKLNALSSSTQSETSTTGLTDRMIQLSQTTIDDIESSRRTVKRIKLQVDDLRFGSMPSIPMEGGYSRPSSPEKGLRTPQRQSVALTRAAQERLEEMRQVIGRRQQEGDGMSRSRPHIVFDTPSKTHTSSTSTIIPDTVRSVETLASEADKTLSRAVTSQDALQLNIRQMCAEFKEKSGELDKAKLELQNARRQTELVKSLLADATVEKDIMYEAFNEELDGMYNDLNLPDDEAWIAMSQDLKQTKEGRNSMMKENSQLKLKLAEAEMQRNEYVLSREV